MTTLEDLERRVRKLEAALRSKQQKAKPSLADRIMARAKELNRPFKLQEMVMYLECSGVLSKHSPISTTTAINNQLRRGIDRGRYRRLRRGWYEVA